MRAVRGDLHSSPRPIAVLLHVLRKRRQSRPPPVLVSRLHVLSVANRSTPRNPKSRAGASIARASASRPKTVALPRP
jgi:hypothetical protein